MSETQDVAHKLDAAGWGLFFIWIGIVFLADISVGLTLVGIGVIVLGAQAARKLYALSFEGFWLVVGLLFLVGGVWEFLDVELPLVPILLIAGGVALLLWAAKGGRPMTRK